MAIDPIFVSKPRTAEERGANTRSGKTMAAREASRDAEPAVDSVDISLEARALSGDSSLDQTTLERFRRLAHRAIEQQRQSVEQTELVRNLLGLEA